MTGAGPGRPRALENERPYIGRMPRQRGAEAKRCWLCAGHRSVCFDDLPHRTRAEVQADLAAYGYTFTPSRKEPTT